MQNRLIIKKNRFIIYYWSIIRLNVSEKNDIDQTKQFYIVIFLHANTIMGHSIICSNIIKKLQIDIKINKTKYFILICNADQLYAFETCWKIYIAC